MQPATAPPRELLTSADVVGLIRDSANCTIGYGCELINPDLTVIEDTSPDVAGGSVTRESYATLHGSATLNISRELDWGRALLRPYVTLTDGTTTARFNLGAYLTAVPSRSLDETPVTYDVTCHDILLTLDDPVGDAYAVTAGTAYLTAVETILTNRGIGAYLIDRHAAATTLPTDKVWIFDDHTTWLNVINDLLAAIGYQGLWSDWDGRLIAQPYQSPRNRASEWTYDTGALTSMLGTDRTVERNYTDAANRWVAYQSNNADGAAPVEGNGMFTYLNQTIGDTSVDARGGRIITKLVPLDVADHTALLAAAQSVIDADMQIPTKVTTSAFPNPLHWHFDRVTLSDPAWGPPVELLSTRWTLPLDGGEMTHEWASL